MIGQAERDLIEDLQLRDDDRTEDLRRHQNENGPGQVELSRASALNSHR